MNCDLPSSFVLTLDHYDVCGMVVSSMFVRKLQQVGLLLTDLSVMLYCQWSLSDWYLLHSLATVALHINNQQIC